MLEDAERRPGAVAKGDRDRRNPVGECDAVVHPRSTIGDRSPGRFEECEPGRDGTVAVGDAQGRLPEGLFAETGTALGEEFELTARTGRSHAQRFGSSAAPLVSGCRGCRETSRTSITSANSPGEDALQLVALDWRGRDKSEQTPHQNLVPGIRQRFERLITALER